MNFSLSFNGLDRIIKDIHEDLIEPADIAATVAGEPECAVGVGEERNGTRAPLQVGVQAMLLQMLEKGAAGAVHDALRHAGRARRVHDVERMPERELFELQRGRRVVSAAKRIEHRALAQSVERGRLARIGHHDDVFYRGHGGTDLAHLVERIKRLVDRFKRCLKMKDFMKAKRQGSSTMIFVPPSKNGKKQGPGKAASSSRGARFSGCHLFR